MKKFRLPSIYFQIEMPSTESQNKIVLHHLMDKGSLTAERAVRLYRIFRLSARIYDLRKKGHTIKQVLEHRDSCHWAVYSMDVASKDVK
jgi:hypothetical protein